MVGLFSRQELGFKFLQGSQLLTKGHLFLQHLLEAVSQVGHLALQLRDLLFGPTDGPVL